jgi:hypothetical protein
MKVRVLIKKLPDHSPIFSAEARAVQLALNINKQSSVRQFLILSDSLSCLKSLENRNFCNPLSLAIMERVGKLVNSGYNTTFIWVPNHIGIKGNMIA